MATATAPGVLQAILTNAPFPASSPIELGSIQIDADSGMGIYHTVAEATAALAIEDTGPFDLPFRNTGPQDRFAVASTHYQLSGSAVGTRPVGALGKLTFGVDAGGKAVSAILHRFHAAEGAQIVIERATSSWRFPREVESASDLAPATWLITETEGRISAKIGTQLGYDFSFVRDAQSLGLTGDIGFKLDANVRATVGLDVSGRYLVLLGREDDSQCLRLRILKLTQKGHNFGLNLSVGVKADTQAIPDSVDDFVKAVFGVHGRQVVKDLLLLEKWTDPNLDLSDAVAGLTNDAALDLLQRTTGIDPKAAFTQAQEKLSTALRTWDALPERVAATTWTILEKHSADELSALQLFLLNLVRDDEVTRAALVTEAISGEGATVDWLQGVAENGLLSLMSDADNLRQNAIAVSSILSAGIVQNLQAIVAERLRLETIRDAATEADFDALDQWLVQRLSNTLDTKLGFEQLEDMKNAIHAVIGKRQQVFDAAKAALERRYSFDIAAIYAKTTTKTAILDATFDLTEPVASHQFKKLLADGDFDALLTQPGSGVTFHTALLTHGIAKRSAVQVNMPFLISRREHVTRSLASLQVETRGEHVSLFQVEASDLITKRSHFRSELAVSATMPFLHSSARVRIGDAQHMTWSYQYASAHRNMSRSDLEDRLRPFISKYMPEHFSDSWLTELDHAAEQRYVLLSMDVSVPGTALQSWFRKRSAAELRQETMDLSRVLQAALKELIRFYYLQDVNRLRQNPTIAALLTWSAIPPSTSARLAGGKLTWNTDREVFWNYADRDLRRAVTTSGAASAALTSLLDTARRRLLAAGQTQEADFFTARETSDFQRMVMKGSGDDLLSRLLFFEARVVQQSAQTLRDIQKFLDLGPTVATKALERLADLGAGITETFHAKLSSVYGDDALRTLGSLVFLEASRTLDPKLRSVRPNALLRITVLNETRQFNLADFLRGAQPDAQDVALTQTLSSIPA